MIILASPLTYLFRFLGMGTVVLGDEIHHVTAGETLYKKMTHQSFFLIYDLTICTCPIKKFPTVFSLIKQPPPLFFHYPIYIYICTVSKK